MTTTSMSAPAVARLAVLMRLDVNGRRAWSGGDDDGGADGTGTGDAGAGAGVGADVGAVGAGGAGSAAGDDACQGVSRSSILAG